MFLHFTAPAQAGLTAAVRLQIHADKAACALSTGASDAGTLHVVTIRSRALAVSADSKDSASLVTEIITSPHALTEVLGDHLQSSR